MTAAQADLAGNPDKPGTAADQRGDVRLDTPAIEDGAAIWRIARDSGTLDLNSAYSYLLWCRDFADTSVVARDAGGAPVGFVTGYVRPSQPETLVVWQVAVDAAFRGRGLAGALLDGLTERARDERGIRSLEATVTPDNTASDKLFRAYARRHGAAVDRDVLFHGDHFPDAAGHEPELLYRIGPLAG